MEIIIIIYAHYKIILIANFICIRSWKDHDTSFYFQLLLKLFIKFPIIHLLTALLRVFEVNVLWSIYFIYSEDTQVLILYTVRGQMYLFYIQ